MALLLRDGTVFRRVTDDQFFRAPAITLANARTIKTSIRRLGEVEQGVIESALILCEGNRIEAAGRLGISRATLYRKIREFSYS